MNLIARLKRVVCGFAACLAVVLAFGAESTTSKEGDWVARDFRFHTGEVLPELRIHYTTIGPPHG
jgi:homoserine O-acetyltransferase